MNLRTLSLMLVSTFAFAIVNTIIKFMDDYSFSQLVFFRSVSSLIITVVQLRLLKIKPWGVNKPILLLRGVSGVLALLMMFILIKKVPLGMAVMLQYLSPVFTAIIAFFWLKEKVSIKQWVYLLICVIGVFFLKKGELSLTWELLMLGLGAAALSGLAYNCVRICKDTDHPLVCVFYFPFVGTPVALLLTLLNDEWIWPSIQDWGLVVVLGAFTQLAQVSMTKALQTDNAASVTVFKYLGVIHAFVIGWLIFGESIPLSTIISGSVILFGIIMFSTSKKIKPKF